jgi:hypothetical protein
LNEFKADYQEKYVIVGSQFPENKFDYVDSEKCRKMADFASGNGTV